jgi:hypothetical protein
LPRVLEHEFGHALGYKHLLEDGHLMHKKQSRGGWVARGLSVPSKPAVRSVAEGVPRTRGCEQGRVPGGCPDGFTVPALVSAKAALPARTALRRGRGSRR